MEQNGLAHCDLSAANLLLPRLEKENTHSYSVELVDVDQLYGHELSRPATLFCGSPCYTPVSFNVNEEGWNETSDRFAGAILLAEILSWSDADVVANSNVGPIGK
jgi:hypothetical protein